jgi:hypothetical protein
MQEITIKIRKGAHRARERLRDPVFIQCINLQAPTRLTLEATYTKWQ